MPIVVIVFVVKKCVRARGIVFVVQGAAFSSSHLFLTAWLVVIPSLGYVIAHTGMAFAGLSGVYTPLLKPSVLFVPAMFSVWEITLLLGSDRLRLMGACPMGV